MTLQVSKVVRIEVYLADSQTPHDLYGLMHGVQGLSLSVSDINLGDERLFIRIINTTYVSK
jgi:hypothetical protein